MSPSSRGFCGSSSGLYRQLSLSGLGTQWEGSVGHRVAIGRVAIGAKDGPRCDVWQELASIRARQHASHLIAATSRLSTTETPSSACHVHYQTHVSSKAGRWRASIVGGEPQQCRCRACIPGNRKG